MPYFVNNAGRTASFVHDLISSGWNGKFVFSSTAATYGDQPYRVIETSDKKPINPYGMSKLHAEQILESAYSAYNFSSIVFRFFNVAGAYGDVGQNKDEPHILTQLSKAAKNKETFNLYGTDYDTRDGTCIRDYVHVLDIANAHLLALDILDVTTGCVKFNLGTSKGTSNLELLNAFKDLADLNYETVAARPGDPAFLVSDASKFTHYTGYTFPNSNLQNIIATHWEYYNID